MNIHIKSILAALSFSFLFYSKSFGLNLFLISIIVITLLVTVKKEHKISWGYSLTYIMTAILVFANPSGFTIFVHFMAFLLLVGKSISKKSSLYISWLIGAVNMLVASAVNYNERTKKTKEKKNTLSPKTISYLKGSFVAICLLFIFTLLYRNANPVFNNLISQIDLNFISIPWVFFTLIGYILFLHILRPYNPKELVEIDESQSNELKRPNESFSIEILKKLDDEHTLGSIVFATLNLLLVFFLVTDIIYLLQEKNITNQEYSQSVHEGVYALMFSIICAIALILYFFRGNLNFFENNKRIKSLTYLWICLNILLVAFTCYKNYEYVEALGFTYKRIGVFVYLLLTLIGLVTAYIKITKIKSFVYLVRTNIAILFGFLCISAAVPWDTMITWYNLNNIQNPDIGYLIDLGNSNSYQLFEYTQSTKTKMSVDYIEPIERKYHDFSKEQSEKTWQEYTLYQCIKKDIK